MPLKVLMKKEIGKIVNKERLPKQNKYTKHLSDIPENKQYMIDVLKAKFKIMSKMNQFMAFENTHNKYSLFSNI